MKAFFSDNFHYNDYRKAIIALGTFDGMHLGHQSLMHKLHTLSNTYNQASMVYTFLNHPLGIINPQKKPLLLMTRGEKIQAFSYFKLDYIAMIPFTKYFSSLSYQEFMMRLLKSIPIAHLVVGYNFTFGYKGEGNVKHLAQMSKEHNFNIHIIPPVMVDGYPISSTRIRTYIREGEIHKANQLLGKAYAISGTVIHGKKIGRTLECPTANLVFPSVKVLPKAGVYVTLTEINGFYYPSVSNIGTNPTINQSKDISLETHILDFHQDIYGYFIRVHFIRKIRDEILFTNIQDLSSQIHTDMEYTRNFFHYQEKDKSFVDHVKGNSR